MARFIERGGARDGTQHDLAPTETTIGRGGGNTIVLIDDRISRQHARVSWDGGQCLLADLGSRNGTYLNGRRLEGPQLLRHGDEVGIGGVTLFFDAADETAPDEPLPAATGLRLDTATAQLWNGAREIRVTAKEYLALLALAERRGALVSKEDLAARVWPEYQGGVGDYNIEQLISRLRRKIEAEPERPAHLLTVRGLGYRLVL